MIYRTSIKSGLKRFHLIKGTLFGLAGTSLLLYGSFLPLDVLKEVGIFYFFMGFSLMALGLIPLRKIQRLERDPDQLIVEEGEIYYFQKGVCKAVFKRDKIESIAYVERPCRIYGIEIKAEKSASFIPYFSEKTFTNLTEQCRAS